MPLHAASTLRTLLFAPADFFAARADRDPPGPLGGAFGVVVAVALLQGVTFAVGFLLVAARAGLLVKALSVAEATTGAAGVALAAGLIVAVLALVGPVVWGVVLHVAMKLADGRGSLADTLRVVRWSTPVTLLVPPVVLAGVALGVGEASSVEAAAR